MPATMRPETARAIGLAWGFGWRIAAGLALGYYLDLWMGTAPLWLFVVTMGSFVAGVSEFVCLSRAEAARTRGSDTDSSESP